MPAEAATVFQRMRHLLNVRIRAREPAGGRADLAKVGVQTAGRRIDQLDHVLTITGQGLLHRAIFKQLCDHRILNGEWL